MDQQKIDGLDGSRDHALVGELPGPNRGGPCLVAPVEIAVEDAFDIADLVGGALIVGSGIALVFLVPPEESDTLSGDVP